MDPAIIIGLVMVLALTAGVVQTVTGFGGGIIMMLFFPLFLPILKASALSTLITLYLTTTLAVKLRKSAAKELILLPLLVFFVTGAAAIQTATLLDTRVLSIVFGIFLMGLSLYFMVIAKNFHMKASRRNSMICAALSGCTSGFFGISGPPMVVYYLAVLGDDKERYLATTQMFFCLSSLYTTGVRVVKGIITVELIPLVLLGMLGMMAGKRIGLSILARIDTQTMKTVIYLFLAVSGVITLIRNLV